MSFNFKEGQTMGGGEQYEIWEYEEGDKLEGLFYGVKHNVGQNDSNIYTIEKDGGEMIDVWGSTVLDGQLSELLIKRNAVSITYNGKKQGKQGKPYKDFTVIVVALDAKGKQQGGEPVYKLKEEDATTTTEED